MIVVTGATGGVGGAVLRQLAAAGQPVRALSRRPADVEAPAGVEVVRADLADAGSLPAAFEGADAAFLYTVFGDSAPALAAAKRAGIRHVVLLSSQAVAAFESGNEIADRHRTVERAVEASGLAWTFLRPGGFASNVRWWAPQVRESGVVRGVYPEATSALIHPADIAAVAVLALTGDGHDGAAYPLTGEQVLSQAEQAGVIGDVIGRPVRYEEIGEDEYVALLSRSIPEQYARGALAAQRAMAGRPTFVSPVFRELTGRAPRTLADWVAEHAAEFK
jgi:uncharacterized protein YbjT (DUF2867 family)